LIGSLERGRGNPSLETLERLARGLRMAVWQLLLMAETKEGPEGDRRR
jgi:transcriptional regulator with XRE-family HTH domain